MKKSHFALLIIAAVMCLTSVYSLAAINQVYEIDFNWYSQYNAKYTNEVRDTSKDRWFLQDYPPNMDFAIVGSSIEFQEASVMDNMDKSPAAHVDFSRHILIKCALGKVHSPEYRIKVTDIAQRANTIEVKVSINSPVRLRSSVKEELSYMPVDIIRVDKSSFPIKGKVLFIFKSQDGDQLAEKYYEIK